MGSRYFITYSLKRPAIVKKAREIEELIRDSGFMVHSMEIDKVVENGIPADTEVLIVLGGDGTLLKSISRLPRPGIPVLTINYGRGGYLMRIEPEKSVEAVKEVLEGRYSIEKALMLSFKVDGKKIGNALNEAYISPITPGKIMEYTVERRNTILYPGISDALIISTPLGSTAYALSAGGPAVDDELEAAVLVPVCPLTNTRPVVLSLNENFTVNVQSNFNIQVLIDGHIQSIFEKSIKLEIGKSEDYVSFIKSKEDENFARRLQKRFRF